jgi:hypothetical protein
LFDQLVDFGLGQRFGQVFVDDLELCLLDHAQVVATGFVKLGDRFAALLGHLVEHRDDATIVELDSLVDFDLLERGKHQPDDAQTTLVTAFHR